MGHKVCELQIDWNCQLKKKKKIIINKKKHCYNSQFPHLPVNYKQKTLIIRGNGACDLNGYQYQKKKLKKKIEKLFFFPWRKRAHSLGRHPVTRCAGGAWDLVRGGGIWSWFCPGGEKLIGACVFHVGEGFSSWSVCLLCFWFWLWFFFTHLLIQKKN